MTRSTPNTATVAERIAVFEHSVEQHHRHPDNPPAGEVKADRPRRADPRPRRYAVGAGVR